MFEQMVIKVHFDMTLTFDLEEHTFVQFYPTLDSQGKRSNSHFVHMSKLMLVHFKAEIQNPKLSESFTCILTLTFDLQSFMVTFCALC